MNLFIFHRDLRIEDNTSLIYQIKEEKKVTPVFIFTPEQIDPKQNKYFSNHSVQFLIESLKELEKSIQGKGGKLYFLYGDTLELLKKIHKHKKLKSISFNIDYTPYAQNREKNIEKWCHQEKITLYRKEDYCLYPFLNGETLKKDKKPYQIYTPFMKHVLKLKVIPVDHFSDYKFEKEDFLKKIEKNDIHKFYKENKEINVKGGRKESLKILSSLGKFKDYDRKRNLLTYRTTCLSAYLHYTTCSIREVYEAILKHLGKKNGLIRELIFRDFYMNIVYYFPYVLEGQLGGKKNKSFRREYDNIQWEKNEKNFQKWKKGETGFPIVDAGMRQMNKTGYMHNRCRMIVSNFLVKDLHIDWKKGEQYFARTLEDYDPINNNSGWQWSTGNGTDSQPYFRIFNPWTQQKDYDSECLYIKKWIPELESVPIKDIHNWNDSSKKYKSILYPEPILCHDIERKRSLEIYKNGLQKK